MREDCSHTLALIGRIRESGPTEAAAHAARIVQHQPALHTIIERAGTAAPCGCRIRLHGDLHLGQVLVCHNDFVFVDFEGEPQRSFAQRRQKHSAARHVASMIRSLDYVLTVTNLGDQGAEEVLGGSSTHPRSLSSASAGSWTDPSPSTTCSVHPTVRASLAADHRVTDGHEGSRFLAVLDHLLQNPEDL